MTIPSSKESFGLETKAAFMTKLPDLVFDLTNQTPRNLIGLYFYSLQTGRTYMFTSLGDGTYCLVNSNGTVYTAPVSYPSNKRLTALFVSQMFSTNNVIEYWKFILKNKNPEKTPLMIKLQGVQYEFE